MSSIALVFFLDTYVLHTVGPIVRGKLKKEREELLKHRCTKLADWLQAESFPF